MIKFDCTNCDFEKNVSDKYSGRDVRCPKCKTPNRLGKVPIKEVASEKKDLIRFLCTGCGQKIKVSNKYAGRRVKCPKCQTPLAVPGEKKPASPLPEKTSEPAETQNITESEPETENDLFSGMDDLLQTENLGEDVEQSDEYDTEYDESNRNFQRPTKRKTGRGKKSGSSSKPIALIIGGVIAGYLLLTVFIAIISVKNMGGASGTGNAPVSTGIIIFLVVFRIILSLMPVAYILLAVSLWKVFSKSGHPGWAIFVPVYNAIVIAKIAEKPVWWLFLCLIPPVGPLIGLIVGLLISLGVAETFGRSSLFGFGLFLMPFVFYPILAFSEP